MGARGWIGCAALLIVGGAGCKPKAPPAAPVEVPAEVLRMAQERPIPDPLRARFNFQIRSESMDVAGSTGGVLVLERPERGHLALMGPLGGPLFTLTSVGDSVSVILPRERRQLWSADASELLEEAVGGLATLDDLFGLLVGDLPLDDARLVEQSVREDEVQVVLDGPQGSVLLVALDGANGTPRSLVAQDEGGAQVLAAAWSPFQQVDEAWLPTEMVLEVPSLDLRLDLRYRNWQALEQAPDVFGTQAPSGFITESLESAIRQLATTLPEAAQGD